MGINTTACDSIKAKSLKMSLIMTKKLIDYIKHRNESHKIYKGEDSTIFHVKL